MSKDPLNTTVTDDGHVQESAQSTEQQLAATPVVTPAPHLQVLRLQAEDRRTSYTFFRYPGVVASNKPGLPDSLSTPGSC